MRRQKEVRGLLISCSGDKKKAEGKRLIGCRRYEGDEKNFKYYVITFSYFWAKQTFNYHFFLNE